MKASQLIEQLSTLLKEYGDRDIRIYTTGSDDKDRILNYIEPYSGLSYKPKPVDPYFLLFN